MLTRLKKASVPVLILAGGIGAFMLLQATKPEPDSNVEAPRPTGVYTEAAITAAAQLAVDIQGEVRARIDTDIVAQVGGRVVSVSPEFIEGGRVRPSESLLVIEDTDYRSALNEAQARLAASQVELEQALADADVARKQLAGQKNPSPLALKKPQVARARAAIQAAEANLALAQTNLARTQISLPFNGRISSIAVNLGQFVTPGKVVGRAFGTDIVEVRLPLNDSQLAALGVPIGYSADSGLGLPVDLTATVGGQIHHWVGRLNRLDAAIEPTTRTIFGTVEVVDPYAGEGMPLAVGLYVDAKVSGRLVEDAISIPTAALRAGNQVFVVSDSGQLEIRDIDLIHRNRERVVLAGGLQAGERVVVSAIRNPIPGMRLQSIDDRPSEGGVSSDAAAN